MSSSAESTSTPPPETAGSAAQQHPVLIYTTWRLAIFIVTLVVLYLVGLRDVWLLVLAFLVSGVVSIFVLDRRRQQAVGGFSSLFRRMNERIDASARAEDDDYVGGQQGAGPASAEDDQPRADQNGEQQ